MLRGVALVVTRGHVPMPPDMERQRGYITIDGTKRASDTRARRGKSVVDPEIRVTSFTYVGLITLLSPFS
jgi:hypothetical protein